jgi:hypothetical protein
MLVAPAVHSFSPRLDKGRREVHRRDLDFQSDGKHSPDLQHRYFLVGTSRDGRDNPINID